jgi:hypothetical protein
LRERVRLYGRSTPNDTLVSVQMSTDVPTSAVILSSGMFKFITCNAWANEILPRQEPPSVYVTNSACVSVVLLRLLKHLDSSFNKRVVMYLPSTSAVSIKRLKITNAKGFLSVDVGVDIHTDIPRYVQASPSAISEKLCRAILVAIREDRPREVNAK